MPGIFEQYFNTPLPNTDIRNQLIALSMRNEAMKPDGVIKGLSQVGKVFTEIKSKIILCKHIIFLL